MADGFHLDTTDVHRLAADLGKAPAKALGPIEAVLKKGAVNIKDGMRDRFRGSRYFKGVARDVTFERVGGVHGFGFETGPETGLGEGHGGGLAGIAVDGGANGGGGTVQIDDLLPAEADAVERFVGEILEGLL